MIIQKLHLHHVACFEHVELDFPPGTNPDKADIHLLVGGNGTGKSSILLTLAQFFTHEMNGASDRFRDEESYAWMKREVSTEAMCARESWPPGILSTGFVGLSGAIQHYESVAFEKPRLAEYRQATAQFKSTAPAHQRPTFPWAVFAYSGQRSIRPFKLDAIAELKSNPFADACCFVHPSSEKDLVQWIANNKTREALAEQKGDHERARQRRETLERVETTLSRITDQTMRFSFDDESLAVTIGVNGETAPLDVLPDGLKSILSWIGDLLMRMDRIPWEGDVSVLDRPFLLLLDEAEVHLHPAWQRRLLPVVQDLFPKAQIIVSTHSPFVVASATDAWIHCLRVEGRRVVADPPLASQVGASYLTILRDVLGVGEEFSVDVEELFARFYELKPKALAGDAAALTEMGRLASQLAVYGVETESIVAQEMRQVQRIAGAVS